MMQLAYSIDGNLFEIAIPADTKFTLGKKEVLSTKETDLTYGQSWYDQGFSVFTLFEHTAFIQLQQGITKSIASILAKTLSTKHEELSQFKLEDYHTFVASQEEHLAIVSQTRDLFTSDFQFDIESVLPSLSNYLGFPLSDLNPMDGMRMHIIVRINRPHSGDYNPPHKDIYEHVDGEYGTQYVPQFINFWIPIAGLSADTSLPLVAGSHLLPEDKIERTRIGARLKQGNYRVRLIKSWNNHNALVRSQLNYGDCLVFTPHLIHGLGYNNSSDVTRVALEFRLFKA